MHRRAKFGILNACERARREMCLADGEAAVAGQRSDVLKAMGVVLIRFSTLPALCQSKSKYEVGTITAVKPHQSGNAASSDAPSYEVSLKIGDTVCTCSPHAFARYEHCELGPGEGSFGFGRGRYDDVQRHYG